MSNYGLIKATSKIQRADTIHDLDLINNFRSTKGLQGISPKGPSVRALEDAVAVSFWQLAKDSIPETVRGNSFYISILPEINSYKLFLKDIIPNLEYMAWIGYKWEKVKYGKNGFSEDQISQAIINKLIKPV